MPRFDVHQHLWPEPLVVALERRSEPPRLRGSLLELREGSFETDLSVHDLDHRLTLLDRDEVDIAIVSLPPTLGSDDAPELGEAYDEGILEVAAAAAGRIRPLAAGRERDGFAGTCISAQRVVAEGLGAPTKPVFVHPGAADPAPPGMPAWWTPVVDYTAEMQAAFAAVVARGVPAVPVVFAILAGGGPFQLERLSQRGDGAVLPGNLYFDTASYGRHALDLVVAACGSDRVVYGSDTPVMDPQATRQAIGDWFDHFAEENPARIFE
jgi:predicted TIM-barrel fold metal-dependent hydrolase